MLIKSLDQSLKQESRLGARFLAGFAGLVCFLLLIELIRFKPEAWMFHFTWYALISATGVLVNLGLIIFVTMRQKSIDASIRYNLLLTCYIILGISETFQRLSTHPAGALFWRDLTLFSGVLTPIAMLVFIFHYTGRHTLKHYVWASALLLIGSLMLIFIGLTTNLIYVNQVASMFQTYYGYEVSIGPAALVYFLWIVIIISLALIELVRYQRLLPSGSRHRQAQIFIYAIIFLIVTSTIIEIILPELNIIVLPVGSIYGAIMGAIVAYGISLKGIFTVNPATVVATILDTMADAVIVTDTDFTTIYSNKFTAVHLQLPEHKMIGRNIGDFIEDKTYNKIKTALSQYAAGKEIAIIDQGEMKTDNYEQRYVDISLSKVMESAQLVGYIFSFSNASEPKFRADLNKHGII